MKIHKGAVLLTQGVEEIKKRLEASSIPVTETGCWLWLGYTEKGYGRFSVSGVTRRVHCVSYVVYNGAIPKGVCVLHKCDITICCNPNHLFLGTRKDNIMDMVKKRRHWLHNKTHCKNGHEYTLENTYFYKRKNNRICRICNAARQKGPVQV